MELLDRYLPAETTLSQHQERIESTPAKVWDALGEANLGASPVLRILFSLRGIPVTGRLGPMHRSRQREEVPSLLGVGGAVQFGCPAGDAACPP